MGNIQDSLTKASQTGSEANVHRSIATMLWVQVASHDKEDIKQLNSASSLRMGGAGNPRGGRPHIDGVQKVPDLHEDMVSISQQFNGALREAGDNTGSRPSELQLTAFRLILIHKGRETGKQPVHKQGQPVTKQGGTLSFLTRKLKIEYSFKKPINFMYYRTEDLLAKGIDKAKLSDA